MFPSLEGVGQAKDDAVIDIVETVEKNIFLCPCSVKGFFIGQNDYSQSTFILCIQFSDE